MWPLQLNCNLSNCEVAPQKSLQGFNRIRICGLCVRAAVLYKLSYEDPYTGSLSSTEANVSPCKQALHTIVDIVNTDTVSVLIGCKIIIIVWFMCLLWRQNLSCRECNNELNIIVIFLVIYFSVPFKDHHERTTYGNNLSFNFMHIFSGEPSYNALLFLIMWIQCTECRM